MSMSLPYISFTQLDQLRRDLILLTEPIENLQTLGNYLFKILYYKDLGFIYEKTERTGGCVDD